MIENKTKLFNKLAVVVTLWASFCFTMDYAFATKPVPDSRPNIVVFFTDDAGFHHFSHFGGNTPTPDIDQLANEGVSFTNAFSPSAVCTPARFSIMTGMYAGRSRHPVFREENPVGEPYRVTWNTFLTKDNTTVHRILSAGGYHTGYVGKWHISEHDDVVLPKIDKNADLDRPKVNKALKQHQNKLSQFIQSMTGADVVKNVLWENTERIPVTEIKTHNPEWLTQGALEFIEERDKQKPFFLFFAATSPHGPDAVETLDKDPTYTPEGKIPQASSYHPPRTGIKKRLQDLNVSVSHVSVSSVFLNDQVAAIRRKLREVKEEDNTVFIFLSDHNSEPGKATTYDSGTRIPMFMKWKSKVKAGSINNNVVQVTDILPTVLDIAKISVPKSLDIDGRSFVPAVEGKAPSRDDIFLEMGWTRAVRTEKYKYVAFRYPKRIVEEMRKGTLKEAPNHLNMPKQGQPNITMLWYPHYFDPDQLYDLSHDPKEQNNLAYDPKYAQVLADMKMRMKAYVKRFDYPFDVEDTAYMESEEFKALAEVTRKRAKQRLPRWARGVKWRIGPEALFETESH